MPLPWASIAVATTLALGAFVLLVARPDKRAHVALASFLIVRSAIMATGAMTPEASTPGEALAYARTNIWFTLVLPLLTLLVARALFPRRWDWTVLAAVGALTAIGIAIAALAPQLAIQQLVSLGPGRYSIDSGPLLYLLACAVVLAEASFVWRASAEASSPEVSRAMAARAAALGSAMSIFVLYSAANLVAFVPQGSSLEVQLFYVRFAVTLVAAGIILVAFPRLFRPLSARGRAVASALVGAVIVLGLLDSLTLTGRIALGGYAGSLVFVRVLFALVLLTGVLRFGLADAGVASRRRVALALRGTLIAVLALATFLAGLLLLGANVVGALAGVALASVVLAASWRPLDRPARWLSAQLLLAPDDPRAVAERARTYAAAVAASKGAGAEGERFLRELRADLDISEKEHELLAEGLASRDKERYHRVEVLGAGATANVELAVDEVAGRRVVVKRFKGLREPATVLREARALAAVKHPRVVPFLEVDRRDDEVYLVLAYAEGGSARQLLDKEGALPPARAVGLVLDLLDGLDALHAQGIVHCDVKAENLLLDRDGRGMLGDFGSARFSAPDLADATLTGGAAEGSLSTISPEALRGATPAPPRDVYAAGALLYRLLTGQHYVPLAGATVFEARERITMGAPLLPHPKVPLAIEPVIRRALAKKPAERYQSAREMRDELAAALARA